MLDNEDSTCMLHQTLKTPISRDIGSERMCRRCGFCCTANSFNHDRVEIRDSDIRRWERLGIWRRIRRFLETSEESESGYIIPLYEEDCRFLDRDRLCILHKKYGYTTKPRDCRVFTCEEKER